MRPGDVKDRVAGHRDMDHRWYVELTEHLIERVEGSIREARPGPVAVGGVGIDVDPDESELLDRPAKLRNGVRRWDPWGLRQLGNADEARWEQATDPMDQVVHDARPDK